MDLRKQLVVTSSEDTAFCSDFIRGARAVLKLYGCEYPETCGPLSRDGQCQRCEWLAQLTAKPEGDRG